MDKLGPKYDLELKADLETDGNTIATIRMPYGAGCTFSFPSKVRSSIDGPSCEILGWAFKHLPHVCEFLILHGICKGGSVH